MVELIRLIDDISTPVKLGWVGVLVWGAAQFMWYRRVRVLPEETENADARSQSLSIAPARDFPVGQTPNVQPDFEADLGEAAGMALEHLLEDVSHHEMSASIERGASDKSVLHQSLMSY